MGKKINDLYRALKAKHGVVDVKFAFGAHGTDDTECQEVYGVVETALRAALEDRTTAFKGLRDGHGIRQRRRS